MRWVPVIRAATPDYCGSLQEGYAAAVEGIVREVPQGGEVIRGQVTLLPGSHLSPADVEELKVLCEDFGLDPVVVPDLSCALDGHIDDTVSPLATGGIPVARLRRAGRSQATLYFGDSLAKAAKILQKRFATPCLRLHLGHRPAPRSTCWWRRWRSSPAARYRRSTCGSAAA